MATDLQVVVDELQAARDAIAPAIEGFVDFDSLNLLAPTKAAIEAAQADFKRRDELLGIALKALKGLLGDRYPVVPSYELSPSLVADLDQNLVTLAAARGRFSALVVATELNLSAGPAEPK